MSRPSIDMVMLAIAHMLSTRATCRKRAVGCVLTNHDGQIIGTGYNGTPRAQPHCTYQPCVGAYAAAGTDTCAAVHAEVNALLQCSSVERIYTAYCTTLPCNNCMKTLLNTSCSRIIYSQAHDQNKHVKAMWEDAGRELIQMNVDLGD
jgi:dCMP deaminase